MFNEIPRASEELVNELLRVGILVIRDDGSITTNEKAPAAPS